jgi:hypothetical protein
MNGRRSSQATLPCPDPVRLKAEAIAGPKGRSPNTIRGDPSSEV